MNMHWLDWIVVATLFVIVVSMAAHTRKYTRSVADFLAAGRSAGRYLITVSEGAAAVGAITVVAWYEKFYAAGFTAQWWEIPVLAVGFYIALSGWIIYRFRQTRAMTMAQFFEMRYSRNFRVFAGILAYLAGIVNFGIFPAVGARFFIYFCGLPESVAVCGVSLSTFVLVMIFLLGVSLIFTFMGGQIAVIVTDFVQGMFCLVACLIIFVVLSRQFSWEQIAEALAMAPPDASLVNPMHTSGIDGFDAWYFIIATFGAVYMTMAWQGASGYNCSARTPHEAKMGKILGKWREIVQGMLILFMPICAYTFLHHPDFADRVASVQQTLGSIDSSQIQKQMTVPVALAAILPTGIMGALCAVMLAAFISTHDTYLHSWGSIFIQDVVLPFRKKPFSPKQHLMLLRLSTCGVAVFIFCFSLFFKQTEYILMFFAITGAIYLGGAGSVIVGGLYWRRGTTGAAWAAMIVGSVLAVGVNVVQQIDEKLMPHLVNDCLGLNIQVDGQRMFAFAMVAAIVTYVLVSLTSKRPEVNMDRILHRGLYAVEEDKRRGADNAAFGLRSLRMGRDFSRWDRVIHVTFIVWVSAWTATFLIGTAYGLLVDVSTSRWLTFWKYYMLASFVMGAITVVWLLIGGLRDLKDMFRQLGAADRDDSDDGIVHGNETCG